MADFQFDFANGYRGWVPGFADYHPDADYQFLHGYRELPRSAGRGGSLFISAMNRSDDLFMYHIRRFDGLGTRASGEASFRVAFASKYVRGAGIGGDPAKSVIVKACMSSHEPVLAMVDSVLRLNIDIGRQTNPGANSLVLGDIEKPKDGTDAYVPINLAPKNTLKWQADEYGSVWVLFGTDSGYEGETALYYTSFGFSLM